MDSHEIHRIAINTILIFLGIERKKGEISFPPMIRDWDPRTEYEMIVKNIPFECLKLYTHFISKQIDCFLLEIEKTDQ